MRKKFRASMKAILILVLIRLILLLGILTYELTCRRFRFSRIINQKTRNLSSALEFFAEGDQVERWLGAT